MKCPPFLLSQPKQLNLVPRSSRLTVHQPAAGCIFAIISSLNTKFFQIWSSVTGYGELCVCGHSDTQSYYSHLIVSYYLKSHFACSHPVINGSECFTSFFSKRIFVAVLVLKLGAAYGHAEKPLLEFVERCKLPFLPTPMGKGVISDEHPLSVAAARSRSVKHCSVRCMHASPM